MTGKNNLFRIVPFIQKSEFLLEDSIKSAKQVVPEWYKNSPRSVDTTTELSMNNSSATNSTYKKCTPFLDALTTGYMAVLNADVEISDADDGGKFIRWRVPHSVVSEHSNRQWEGLVPPAGYVNYLYKWGQDFSLLTPPGYSCLFSHPHNRFDLPFQTLSGVVDTDTFDMPIHFPFFIRQDFTGIIEKGTPICQILPFKRDNWESKKEEYSEKRTSKSILKFHSKILRSYKSQYWSRKDYN
jgi:Family of unknown function (DUF6065)